MLRHTEKAATIFPWAEIPTGLTIGGLFSHRMSSERSAWARVLLGTDDQIASAIAALVSDHTANFKLTPEAHVKFARHLVGSLEEILRNGFPFERWRDFAAGYKAAAESATIAEHGGN